MTDTAKNQITHTSVLLQEVLEGLSVQEGEIFLDCTLGEGGHSLEVFRKFADRVEIIGLDADQGSIDRASSVFAEADQAKSGNYRFVKSNFRHLDAALDSLGVTTVDKILFDLGWSSVQFATSGRGFSFAKDEPLVMTFNESAPESALTAYDIVNTFEEENLADILWGFGEERYSRRIARAIVEYRSTKGTIETTNILESIVREAVPAFYRRGRLNPATKTFQAIRIAVNDELGALSEALSKAVARLNPGGRVAVISFHSLEDRIVKRFFKEKADEGVGCIMTKKPITASRDEVLHNPRSRSAKLRILEKIINQ